jgi:2,4-dienoyl-CoA reductase-like NADH-dependent reductase (Old Yellow Enzyme family)/thioredoxin reductase
MKPLNLLFTPLKIGGMEVNNRIILAPMGTSLADRRGSITDAFISYYRERAGGGAGYITVGNACVHPSGRAAERMVCIYDDAHTAGFVRLAEAIHAVGGKVVVQLNHAGRQSSSSITGQKLVAPSAIACKIMKEAPRALSREEIEDLVEAFSAAALRIKRAGCDGVEFHMAHGYLICQFLSPYTNHRQDEYGGSTERRFRFAGEILARTRKKVGQGFPLICRISADEMVDGGLRIEEARVIARHLVTAGADAIHVSACNYESYAYNMPCYYLNEGCFIPLAAEIKSVIDVPVIAVGRITSPFMAEEILQRGQADLIAMGRALVADPHLVQKTRQGNLSAIRPCLSCNQCVESISRDRLECTVNPDIGYEAGREHHQASRPQKVLVIGAGPGGMEAARVAAQRGHAVTLYEAAARLGGQLFSAALPPMKDGFRLLIDYYGRVLAALGVKIVLNTTCTADFVKAQNPDAVIVATGSHCCAFTSDPACLNVMSYARALNDIGQVGDNVIIAGGGPRGAELADYLAREQKQVTIVEKRKKIGFGLPTGIRFHLENRLKAAHVKMLTRTVVLDISEKRMQVKTKGSVKELTGFDTVITAVGDTSNNDLARDLRNFDRPVHVIGDANEPRGIKAAIAEGAAAARRI